MFGDEQNVTAWPTQDRTAFLGHVEGACQGFGRIRPDGPHLWACHQAVAPGESATGDLHVDQGRSPTASTAASRSGSRPLVPLTQDQIRQPASSLGTHPVSSRRRDWSTPDDELRPRSAWTRLDLSRRGSSARVVAFVEYVGQPGSFVAVHRKTPKSRPSLVMLVASTNSTSPKPALVSRWRSSSRSKPW